MYTANDCTYHGLHDWHKALFEKFGWMIMAIDHHHDLKLKSYKESLEHIQECLKDKIRVTKDEDRINDLKILLDNIKCLECDLDELIKIKSNNNSNYQNTRVKGEDATNCGLQHWMKHKYEYLGWMCLAQKHGNKLKIAAYIDAIERLVASIEKKINEVEEKDRKDDLKITLEHSKLLKYYACELLMDKDKKSSRKSTRSRRSTRSRKSTRKTRATKKKSFWL